MFYGFGKIDVKIFVISLVILCVIKWRFFFLLIDMYILFSWNILKYIFMFLLNEFES